MKISSGQLQMASTHVSQSYHQARATLNMWVGDRQPKTPSPSPQPTQTDTVSLSDQGKKNASADAVSRGVNSAVDNDPRLSLIRTMVELMTGRRIHLLDTGALSGQSTSTPPSDGSVTPANTANATASAGYGVEYNRHESYSETEETSFSASGTVQTADGRSISFNLDLSMTRSYHEESDVSLKLGDAARKTTDPLVLNFAGNAVELTNQRFAFDLNSDGSKEQINFVQPGSGFLVFDKNHDGVVNNGSELFGPTSGNGFSELSALDSDKNGWIDENDPAFGQLQVWSRDQQGNSQLQSLAAAGVGAIALSHVSTPFDIKTHANQLLGQIRSSGIFLQEDGSTGTIQQVDLTA